jgi:hypothetical protein
MIKNLVRRFVQRVRRLIIKKNKMKVLQATEQVPETLITIHGTGKSKHLPVGSEHQVLQADADALVKAGKASLTAVKEKASKEDKTDTKEKNHKAGPNDSKK